MIEKLKRLVLLSMLLFWMVSPLGAQTQESPPNNGEDFTRPITRLDLRFKYQEETDCCQNEVLTLRNDSVFKLNQGWTFATRFDVPYTWVQCHGNEKVKTQGLSDLLLQGLLITPTYGKWTYALGLRTLFPTTKNEDTGSQTYRLLPTVGIKYDLKDWMKGAWCAVLIREDFNVSRHKSESSVQQTYIQPYLNIDLPQDWFLTFSPETRYNWKIHAWFVPFDI